MDKAGLTYDEVKAAALSLPMKERRRLSLELGRSLAQEARKAAPRRFNLATIYVSEMEYLIGESITRRDRTHLLVCARFIVAFTMRQAGFERYEIAEALNLKYDAPSYAYLRIRDYLSLPESYPKEVKLYNDYITKIHENNDLQR